MSAISSVAPSRHRATLTGCRSKAPACVRFDGPHKLELKLSLRNRLDVALAYLALELTLLDNITTWRCAGSCGRMITRDWVRYSPSASRHKARRRS